MEKIMFNDKYGLTDAVLQGHKTMTRRIINYPFDDEDELSEWGISTGGKAYITIYRNGRCMKDIYPTYQPGEEVAVAQCYEDAILDVGEEKWNKIHKWYNINYLCHEKGLHNKMFVRADLMPHRIKITNINIERLQDISEEDCLKEGVEIIFYGEEVWYKAFDTRDGCKATMTAREAFSILIDKVSGKGTWKSNPWVFAYTFELVR